MKTWNQLQQQHYVNMNLFLDFYNNKESLPFDYSSGEDLVRKTVLFLIDDYFPDFTDILTEEELVNKINSSVISLYSKFDSAKTEEDFCEMIYAERDLFAKSIIETPCVKTQVITLSIKDIKYLYEIEENH